MRKPTFILKLKLLISLIAVLFLFFQVFAQEKSKKTLPDGKPVLWEQVNIAERDLFLGPGGAENLPDLSRITFIKEETEGYNKKFRIKDGAGRIWITKYGREAQPETVAVRLLWALGYKTEVNYLVPSLAIPAKGTFKNVRLEARPAGVNRLDEWQWKDNPFIGTNELQGLKIMMVFFNNWDIGDFQNKVLKVEGDGGTELHYIISDLGATFGKLGNNNLPVIYRLGRSINKPQHYLNSEFISGVAGSRLDLAYKGKSRDLFDDITIEQGRWLVNLLNQLTDWQIEDALRAANYAEADKKVFFEAIKKKINELNEAVK